MELKEYDAVFEKALWDEAIDRTDSPIAASTQYAATRDYRIKRGEVARNRGGFFSEAGRGLASGALSTLNSVGATLDVLGFNDDLKAATERTIARNRQWDAPRDMGFNLSSLGYMLGQQTPFMATMLATGGATGMAAKGIGLGAKAVGMASRLGGAAASMTVTYGDDVTRMRELGAGYTESMFYGGILSATKAAIEVAFGPQEELADAIASRAASRLASKMGGKSLQAYAKMFARGGHRYLKDVAGEAGEEFAQGLADEIADAMVTKGEDKISLVGPLKEALMALPSAALFSGGMSYIRYKAQQNLFGAELKDVSEEDLAAMGEEERNRFISYFDEELPNIYRTKYDDETSRAIASVQRQVAFTWAKKASAEGPKVSPLYYADELRHVFEGENVDHKALMRDLQAARTQENPEGAILSALRRNIPGFDQLTMKVTDEQELNDVRSANRELRRELGYTEEAPGEMPAEQQTEERPKRRTALEISQSLAEAKEEYLRLRYEQVVKEQGEEFAPEDPRMADPRLAPPTPVDSSLRKKSAQILAGITNGAERLDAGGKRQALVNGLIRDGWAKARASKLVAQIDDTNLDNDGLSDLDKVILARSFRDEGIRGINPGLADRVERYIRGEKTPAEQFSEQDLPRVETVARVGPQAAQTGTRGRMPTQTGQDTAAGEIAPPEPLQPARERAQQAIDDKERQRRKRLAKVAGFDHDRPGVSGVVTPRRSGTDRNLFGHYLPENRLAVYYRDAAPEDVFHEWFHYMASNGLIPTQYLQEMINAYSPDINEPEDKRRSFNEWTAEERMEMEERAVRDFLAHIRGYHTDAKVYPRLAKALEFMQKSFAASYHYGGGYDVEAKVPESSNRKRLVEQTRQARDFRDLNMKLGIWRDLLTEGQTDPAALKAEIDALRQARADLPRDSEEWNNILNKEARLARQVSMLESLPAESAPQSNVSQEEVTRFNELTAGLPKEGLTQEQLDAWLADPASEEAVEELRGMEVEARKRAVQNARTTLTPFSSDPRDGRDRYNAIQAAFKSGLQDSVGVLLESRHVFTRQEMDALIPIAKTGKTMSVQEVVDQVGLQNIYNPSKVNIGSKAKEDLSEGRQSITGVVVDILPPKTTQGYINPDRAVVETGRGRVLMNIGSSGWYPKIGDSVSAKVTLKDWRYKDEGDYEGLRPSGLTPAPIPSPLAVDDQGRLIAPDQWGDAGSPDIRESAPSSIFGKNASIFEEMLGNVETDPLSETFGRAIGNAMLTANLGITPDQFVAESSGMASGRDAQWRQAHKIAGHDGFMKAASEVLGREFRKGELKMESLTDEQVESILGKVLERGAEKANVRKRDLRPPTMAELDAQAQEMGADSWLKLSRVKQEQILARENSNRRLAFAKVAKGLWEERMKLSTADMKDNILRTLLGAPVVETGNPEAVVERLRAKERIAGSAKNFWGRAGEWVRSNFNDLWAELNHLDDGDPNGVWHRSFGDIINYAQKNAAQLLYQTHQELRRAEERIGKMPDMMKAKAYGKGRIALTLNEAIGIYLQTGGGQFADRVAIIENANKKLGKDLNERRSTIRSAIKDVQGNQEAMNYVQLVREYMDKALYRINKFRVEQGLSEIGRVEFYFPRERVDGKLDYDDSFSAIENWDEPPKERGRTDDAFTRERGDYRTAKYYGSPVNLDTIGVFNRYMAIVDNYIGKAESIGKLKALLSDRDIMDAMAERYGSNQEHETLRALIDRERFPGGRAEPMTDNEVVMRNIRTNAMMAMLWGRPISWARQAVSGTYAIGEIGYGCIPKMMHNFTTLTKEAHSNPSKAVDIWTGRHNPIGDTALYKRMIKYDPYIIGRMFDPEMADIVQTRYRHGWAAKAKIKGYSVAEVGMGMFRNVDIITVTATWNTAFDTKVRELSHSGMTNQQIEAEAAKFASGVVSRTQPPSGTSDRNLWQTGREWQRMMTPFTGQLFKLFQYQRTEIYAPLVRAWQRGTDPISKLQEVGKTFLKGEYGKTSVAQKAFFSMILPTLMLGMLARRRLPEKDEIFTDLIAFNISTVPVLGPLLSIALIYGWRDPPAETIIGGFGKNIANIGKDIFERDWSPETFRDMLELSRAGGLPDMLVRPTAEALDAYYKDTDFDWAKALGVSRMPKRGE